MQAQNLLSKKDLKNLKGHILDQYPGIEDAQLDQLLPEGSVKVFKLDNRCLLYSNGDETTAFFDAEGRGDLFPTLNTLWQFPYMMQEVTIYAPVSKYVLNGADLMLPGVIVPANGIAGLGSVNKGQPRCIKIEGNPYPIAVGKMLVNQTQMEKLKGKGLEVLHVYKDILWTNCGKISPNTGFTEMEDEIAPCADASYKPAANVRKLSSSSISPGTPSSKPTQGATSPKANQAATSPKATQDAATADKGTNVPEDSGEPAAGGRAAADWTQDELLDFCLLQAFTVSLTDPKTFPIEVSEMYEKHMKPMRPEGTTLDVKKSSHKQIGKYLNVLRKAKAIDVNEKKGVITVIKVDMKHKVFVQMEEKFAKDLVNVVAVTSEAKVETAAVTPPEISTFWKATHYTESLFKAVGKSKSDLYTWEVASAALKEYCQKESLLLEDETVKISKDLVAMLYKSAGGEKKDASYPETASFSELEDKLQDRLQEHTCVEVAGVGQTTRKGPPVKIEVSLSRKGAHNVSRICNLEAFGLDVALLGDELKKKLNCTVYMEDMPGKNTKDKMMQLQGHVDKELADYLLARYGISRSFLSVK